MTKQTTAEVAGAPEIIDGLRSAIAVATAAVAAVASVVFLAFLAATLGASSLWLDELYTLHFSDPSLGVEELARSRLSTDSNPPLYYLLIYALRALAGTSVDVVRGFSFGCAAMMAAALFFGTRGFLSRNGRCALVLFAATSPAVLIYAREARGYMLMMALATLACLLALRIIRNRQQRPAVGQLAGLAAVWVLLSATHHFGFLFGGALVAALILDRRAGPGTARLIALGTLIALAVVPFYALQLAAVRANQVTAGMVAWITREPSFIASNGLGGLHYGFGGPVELAVLAAMLAIAAVAIIRRKDALATPPGERSERIAIARVLVLSAVLTLAGSLIITVLAVPIITYRNLLVVAPALWLALAVAIDGAWAGSQRGVVAALCAAMLLLIGLRMARLELAFQPDKEEWRASADFVVRQSSCSDVAVVVPNTLQMQVYAESLKLAGGSARLHPVMAATLDAADPAARRAALRRAVPANAACGLVLWSVIELDEEDMPRVEADIRAEWADAVTPQVFRFEHRACQFDWLGATCVPRADAFVILAH